MMSNNVFRGQYVDMRPHDLLDDTWMICLAGSRQPLVIGTRNQILDEYDKINTSGIIPDYTKTHKKPYKAF